MYNIYLCIWKKTLVVALFETSVFCDLCICKVLIAPKKAQILKIQRYLETYLCINYNKIKY